MSPDTTITVGQTARVEAKPLFTSLTFWGIVISMIAAALNKHGFNIEDSEVQKTTSHVMELLTWIGGLLALLGRWKATRPLSVGGGTKDVTIKLLVLCLLCAALLLSSGGCKTQAEFGAVRDGMDQQSATIRAEHLEWSRILAGDNNGDGHVTAEDGPVNFQLLPQLNALPPSEREFWLHQRELTHEQYDDTVKSSRQKDGPFLPLLFPTTQSSK